MAKNQLSHAQAFKLFKYMENRAPDGEIPETVGQIAKEASLALALNINAGHIDRTARELGIKLVRKQMGQFANGNGAVQDHNVAEVVNRLNRIEDKLDRLMKAFGYEYDG